MWKKMRLIAIGVLTLQVPIAGHAAAAPALSGTASLSDLRRGIAVVTAMLDVELQTGAGNPMQPVSAVVTFAPSWAHAATYPKAVPSSQGSVAHFRAPISFSLAQYATWNSAAHPVVRATFEDPLGNVVHVDVALTIQASKSGVSP